MSDAARGVAVTKPRGVGLSERNPRIAALAQRQGGHVTRAQLVAEGLGTTTIDRHVTIGRLIRVHRGVYAVGHLPTNPIDRAHGVLLAAGPRSALAAGSAAALWDLFTAWPVQTQLISPLQRRVPGVTTHRCGTLLHRDITTLHGLRVTSPARTLLDIARSISTRKLHRFHNELRMRGLITNAQLIDVAERNRCHRGARLILKLAGASDGEPKRSNLEIEWTTFATRHQMPPYEMNVSGAGYRVDVLFRHPKPLIIELDGWSTHGTRQAYEQDRDRDANILAQTGIPTVRITRDGLHARPRRQAQRVNAILARGS